MIVPPYRASQSCTYRSKPSRPRSRWLFPSFASVRPIAAQVEMPAWSYPGWNSVSSPRMRDQRTSVSSIDSWRTWPIVSEPEMFGGGCMTPEPHRHEMQRHRVALRDFAARHFHIGAHIHQVQAAPLQHRFQFCDGDVLET